MQSVPGDHIGNRIVDAADYTVWRDTLGTTTDFRADGDDNQMVNADDYTFWKNRFGNTSGSGSLTATNNVPEPNCFALWLFVLFAWSYLSPGRRTSV